METAKEFEICNTRGKKFDARPGNTLYRHWIGARAARYHAAKNSSHIREERDSIAQEIVDEIEKVGLRMLKIARNGERREVTGLALKQTIKQALRDRKQHIHNSETNKREELADSSEVDVNKRDISSTSPNHVETSLAQLRVWEDSMLKMAELKIAEKTQQLDLRRLGQTATF